MAWCATYGKQFVESCACMLPDLLRFLSGFDGCSNASKQAGCCQRQGHVPFGIPAAHVCESACQLLCMIMQHDAMAVMYWRSIAFTAACIRPCTDAVMFTR
jgi:hypothetical protein